MNKLGYPLYGAINLTTAGGTVAIPMCLVKLTLFSNVTNIGARIVLDNISVAAVDPATQQYKALIGRDILRNKHNWRIKGAERISQGERLNG